MINVDGNCSVNLLILEVIMYRATRKLIEARQQHTNYVVEPVVVTQIGGGVANDCFNNAYDVIEANQNVTLVSGWLIGSYDKYRCETQIVQHYWNADSDGNFFDTTPGIGGDFEYVIDTDIGEYGQVNINAIDSCVSSSLLLKDDEFTAVDMVHGNLRFRSISQLSTRELFDTAHKNKMEFDANRDNAC